MADEVSDFDHAVEVEAKRQTLRWKQKQEEERLKRYQAESAVEDLRKECDEERENVRKWTKIAHEANQERKIREQELQDRIQQCQQAAVDSCKQLEHNHRSERDALRKDVEEWIREYKILEQGLRSTSVDATTQTQTGTTEQFTQTETTETEVVVLPSTRDASIQADFAEKELLGRKEIPAFPHDAGTPSNDKEMVITPTPLPKSLDEQYALIAAASFHSSLSTIRDMIRDFPLDTIEIHIMGKEKTSTSLSQTRLRNWLKRELTVYTEKLLKQYRSRSS